MTPEHDDLLQRELDGALDEQERTALHRLAAVDPELAARRAELARLSSLLQELVEEPPPGFSASVLRQLPARLPKAEPEPGPFESLRDWLTRPTNRRPVLAFAAGILLGGAAALIVLSDPRAVQPDSGGVAATALPSVRLSPSQTIEQTGFDEAGLRGEVTTRRADGRLLAEVRIDSGSQAEVVIEFAAEELAAVGFERSGTAPTDVALEPGRLRLTQAGPGSYRLVLESRTGGGSPIRIGIASGQGRVSRSLRSRAGGG